MAEDTGVTLLHKIDVLVREEQQFYGREPSHRDQIRLEKLKIELDQCWDLLRQREALREFGKDPRRARLRPASVVEKYIG